MMVIRKETKDSSYVSSGESLVAKLGRYVQVINKVTIHFCMLVFIIGIVITLYAVIMRYVFLRAPSWGNELARFFLIWSILVAAAPAVSEGVHLRINIFVTKFWPKGKRIVSIIAGLLFAMFSLLLIVVGYNLTMHVKGQLSAATEISMGWPYSAIPVTGVLMFINIVYTYIIASDNYDEEEACEQSSGVVVKG